MAALNIPRSLGLAKASPGGRPFFLFFLNWHKKYSIFLAQKKTYWHKKKKESSTKKDTLAQKN